MAVRNGHALTQRSPCLGMFHAEHDLRARASAPASCDSTRASRPGPFTPDRSLTQQSARWCHRSTPRRRSSRTRSGRRAAAANTHAPPTRPVRPSRVHGGARGGKHGLAFASGLAAEDTLLRTIASPGSHFVVPDDAYGGTYRLFVRVHQRWGVARSGASDQP